MSNAHMALRFILNFDYIINPSRQYFNWFRRIYYINISEITKIEVSIGRKRHFSHNRPVLFAQKLLQPKQTSREQSGLQSFFRGALNLIIATSDVE